MQIPLAGLCYRDLFAQRKLRCRAEPGQQIVVDGNRVLAVAERAEPDPLVDERAGDLFAQRRLHATHCGP
jgi:hypothetical protein